ncbi:hypothetical protein [Desulfosarcina sp.]|uniref:hypothetical protein n=1 Tax=Desulfosarcina sp. TaxID=2027861 RepID=UPI003970FD77
MEKLVRILIYLSCDNAVKRFFLPIFNRRIKNEAAHAPEDTTNIDCPAPFIRHGERRDAAVVGPQ